jgi:hypothetical protein
MSTPAESNANRITYTQGIRANAATLSNEQQAVFQILNELIQTEICVRWPKFCYQDHAWDASAANFIMQILTAAPYLCNPELDCWKLISVFSKTVLVIWLQFGRHLLARSEEI